ADRFVNVFDIPARVAAAAAILRVGAPAPAARSSTCPREVELARYEHVQRHVTHARYLGDYKIWLEFNDGRKGVVDLADELYGEEMSKLRNRDRVCEFYLAFGLRSLAG